MAIVSSGIGSGLDINGLVSQLVSAETTPSALRLTKREAASELRISSLGAFQSALSQLSEATAGLADSDNLVARKTTSSAPEILTLTALGSAQTGSYDLVVEQLSQAHKLTSQGVASPDTIIGTGTLVLNSGAQSLSLTIDETNNSLAGIRDAINLSVDNPGVQASIVQGDTGSHLILTAKESGAGNAITVTSSGGDGGLSSLTYDPAGSGIMNLTEAQIAQDARIKIDGITHQSASNTIDGAVDGLTLNLHAADPLETVKISIDTDKGPLESAVRKFVEKYNELNDLKRSQTSYNADNGQTGPLFGDFMVRGFSNHVSASLTQRQEGLYGSLSSLGIKSGDNGSLSIDEAVFGAALKEDSAAVIDYFSNEETGLAQRLDNVFDGYLGDTGVIAGRTEGLQNSLDDIEKQRERLELRATALEARYRKQFNNLDSLLNRMNSVSSFLAQQLASLPGSGGG